MKISLGIINIINRLLHSSNNTKVVAKNTLYAFIIKGLALAISFFSAPLFIRYFNDNEVLGLWYTLLSMLTWFLTFDFGIGNGIRNHLVKALSEGNRLNVRYILSSGLYSIGIITIILSAIGCWVIFSIDLNRVFNVSAHIISKNTLQGCTLMVFIAIMMRFMLTTVSSIYYALQKSAVNNFLAFIVSGMQFLFIIIFRFDTPEDALFNISIAYLVISNLPIIVAGIWIFCRDLKDCRPSCFFISKESTSKILGIGIIFFFCQIFYLLIANTNEFFVSHFWGTTYTADYSFYYKITMLLSTMVSLALTPTWSMITKAYAEKNFVWLNKLYRVFKFTGFCIVFLQFLIIPILQPIMNIWLGKGILNVNYITAIAFACFGASFLYSSMLSTIVCGLAKMKLQFWCYGIGAILKIIFIILIARISDNWTWVVWSNVFVLAPYCLFQQLQLDRLFNCLRNGKK